MKKVPIQIGVWVFIILSLYLYLGNPLEKSYNLALIALILSVFSLVASLFLNKLKIYNEIGRLCILALFCATYFFL